MTKKIIIESLPQKIPSNFEDFKIIKIPMNFFERSKVRRRLKVENIELLLSLPTGTKLKPGTILYYDEAQKLAFQVEGKEEEVLVIYPKNFEEIVKAVHLLGNFHQAIDIDLKQNAIITLFDSTLYERVEKMGITVRQEKRVFEGMLLGGHIH